MSWFDDLKTPRVKTQVTERTSKVPEGLWVKCSSCGEILQSKLLKENHQVCTECGFHFRLSSSERISLLSDTESFEELSADLKSEDPLHFDDTRSYRERLQITSEQMNMSDACIIGKASLNKLPYFLGIFEFKFMGGSMGVVVGEKITRLFEISLEKRLPVVIVSSSGGARMQEGILSLMQMAKASALVSQMRENRVPFISLLTDPTTGGVAASFAMQGDLVIAEPGALIGFAGPRVIQQTIRQALPPDCQKSEYLLRHGFIDQIISRNELPKKLYRILWRLGHGHCRFPKGLEES